ncbi:Uncharacterised protein [Amycolatopsis camponoti]|uniref:Uncharacterized protein n=1 Tax=Amycolatopsis camponoti TaxID=2606593 RepID=A0A6I8LNH5_9PSEU|nr:Uncharacterised protein [Amycolatopsis camponoti]
MGREEQLRLPVAGFFDGHPVTRRNQHPAEQVEGLLRPLRDEHVVGVGAHRAGHADVAGDRRAQAGVPGRIRVVRDAVTEFAGEEAPPGFEREQRRVGDADAEVVRRRLRHRGDRRRQRPPDHLRPWPVRRRSLARLRHRQRTADVRPGADPAGEEPVGGQPVVGDRDGVARDRQAPRQLPGRRQPLPRPQPAVQHGVAQLPVDPDRQVATPGQADVEVHPASLHWPNPFRENWIWDRAKWRSTVTP